ncbi:hypothetical protein, partial [Parasutterella excrementihominis]
FILLPLSRWEQRGSMSLKSGKLPTYWKVPEGLEAETFKKPSAKRIANRLKKRKNLQPNEIAKRGYRRKGMR